MESIGAINLKELRNIEVWAKIGEVIFIKLTRDIFKLSAHELEGKYYNSYIG